MLAAWLTCACRHDGDNTQEKWDPDWVIPSTHRLVEEYVYISASNFPEVVWLEKLSKIKKMKDHSLADFAANYYGYPLELLACHSTWGDRLCQAMRGKDKEHMKKLNACVPSLEWVMDYWVKLKDGVWDMNGVKLLEDAAELAAAEAADMDVDKDEDEFYDEQATVEEALEAELAAENAREATKPRKGKKAQAPDGSSSDDGGDSSSESESESESDNEEEREKQDKWAARMAENEAVDLDDGNAECETLPALDSLAAIPETAEDKAEMLSPSKHASSAAKVLYSPVKASTESDGV